MNPFHRAPTRPARVGVALGMAGLGLGIVLFLAALPALASPGASSVVRRALESPFLALPLVGLTVAAVPGLWLAVGERARLARDRAWPALLVLLVAWAALQVALTLPVLVPSGAADPMAAAAHARLIGGAARVAFASAAALAVALALRGRQVPVPANLAAALAAFPLLELVVRRFPIVDALGELVELEAGLALWDAVLLAPVLWFTWWAVRAHEALGTPNPRWARSATLLLGTALLVIAARFAAVQWSGMEPFSPWSHVFGHRLPGLLEQAALVAVALALTLSPAREAGEAAPPAASEAS